MCCDARRVRVVGGEDRDSSPLARWCDDAGANVFVVVGGCAERTSGVALLRLTTNEPSSPVLSSLPPPPSPPPPGSPRREVRGSVAYYDGLSSDVLRREGLRTDLARAVERAMAHALAVAPASDMCCLFTPVQWGMPW